MTVLDMLLRTPGVSGADIVRQTGIKTGSLYPLLMRLEEAGWLVSEWERGEPSRMGRPRKRFYSVTNIGRARAQAHAREQLPIFGRLAW